MIDLYETQTCNNYIYIYIYIPAVGVFAPKDDTSLSIINIIITISSLFPGYFMYHDMFSTTYARMLLVGKVFMQLRINPITSDFQSVLKRYIDKLILNIYFFP